MPTQYCVMARFTGPVYHDRKYKGIVTESFEEAQKTLKVATVYYSLHPEYQKELQDIVIMTREVTEWRKEE